MHNIIKDKYKILGLIGSFYTNQMNSQASKQAGRITYVPFQTNITSKINQIIQYLSGNCYSIADYLVIPITETVIEYGVLSENQDFRSIEYKNFYKTYINNLELQKNQRIIYKINFNKDIYITALQLDEDASLLFEGVDFTSEFGCIYTYNTPSSIFGDSIHVRKYIQKKVNSNNYRLGVQDIYGDTNFITDFYRNNQSLKAFKYALLQAAGFPIIQEDDYIKNKLRTKDGCVYVTSKGKFYTADFKHNELNINDIVNKNQYIGSEILSIILPEDPIPNDLTHITFNGGSITGNKDIIISNSTKTLFNDNIFIAENFAQGGDGKQAYLNYINQLGAADKPSSSVPDSMNCIDFLRNVVATDRCLLIQIDEERISYDMTMKLKSFIIDNAPIGSIIAYCNGKPTVDPGPQPPIIVESSTTVVSFGNEVNPDPELITDSFYYNNVYGDDIGGSLTSGASVTITSSSKVWAGPNDGSIEGTWENQAAINEINTVLKLKHGFTSQDFATGSDIYYTASGIGSSTSQLKLDLKDTSEVGDNIILVVSITSRSGPAGGFWVEGIDNAQIQYAGNDGTGFTQAEGTYLTYNDSMADNWSNDTEGAQLFMVTGNVSAQKLITLGQPSIARNGWQILAYRTYRQIN